MNLLSKVISSKMKIIEKTISIPPVIGTFNLFVNFLWSEFF